MPDYDFEEFDREPEEIVNYDYGSNEVGDTDNEVIEVSSNYETSNSIEDISFDDDLTF